MSEFSPGPWDWWLRQPEAKVWNEVRRRCISVPTIGRLSSLIGAVPEMLELLKRYREYGPGEALGEDVDELLARIEGRGP